MGKINAILAAIFCAAAPLSASETADLKTEVSQMQFKLGKETVSSVRSAYERGEYDEFLTETDEAYRQADLTDLTQARKGEIPSQFQDSWEERLLALRSEKNQQLMSVISDEDDSLFAQKVRSLAAEITTPEQEKALSKLNAFVARAPGEGMNGDENSLIDLDLEYEYKLLHTTLAADGFSADELLKRQIALRMEKMDRMIAAAKHFQDPELKQAVSIASATLDARLARNLDGSDLNALARDKTKPNTSSEQRVYSILSLYQTKFSDLMKELEHAVQ